MNKLKKISLIVWFTSLGSLLLFFLLAATFNLRIGLPVQDVTCLPYKAMLLRHVKPDSITRGDFVTFVNSTNRMSKKFNNQYITKMVGAVPGDTISIASGKLFINGKLFIGYNGMDLAEKAAIALKVNVNSFERTEIVPPGHIFMVGTLPKSFDSRYWGFLPISEVVGTAYPII